MQKSCSQFQDIEMDVSYLKIPFSTGSVRGLTASGSPLMICASIGGNDYVWV